MPCYRDTWSEYKYKLIPMQWCICNYILDIITRGITGRVEDLFSKSLINLISVSYTVLSPNRIIERIFSYTFQLNFNNRFTIRLHFIY